MTGKGTMAGIASKVPLLGRKFDINRQVEKELKKQQKRGKITYTVEQKQGNVWYFVVDGDERYINKEYHEVSRLFSIFRGENPEALKKMEDKGRHGKLAADFIRKRGDMSQTLNNLAYVEIWRTDDNGQIIDD